MGASHSKKKKSPVKTSSPGVEIENPIAPAARKRKKLKRKVQKEKNE